MFQYVLGAAGPYAQDEDELGAAGAVVSSPKPFVEEPGLYKVYLHNDDYTPMDFVVNILEMVFHFESAEANKIMLDVHRKGFGLCGTYIYEIAATKVSLVTDSARRHEYPLNCTMERY